MALIEHAMLACPAFQIKHLFAIVLEGNEASLKLLEKMGFEKWGYLPRVADPQPENAGFAIYLRAQDIPATKFCKSQNEECKTENRGAGVGPHPCFRESFKLS